MDRCVGVLGEPGNVRLDVRWWLRIPHSICARGVRCSPRVSMRCCSRRVPFTGSCSHAFGSVGFHGSADDAGLQDGCVPAVLLFTRSRVIAFAGWFCLRVLPAAVPATCAALRSFFVYLPAFATHTVLPAARTAVRAYRVCRTRTGDVPTTCFAWDRVRCPPLYLVL